MDESVDDEWEVPIEKHLQQQIDKLNEDVDYYKGLCWKLDGQIKGILNSNTPRDAAQLLADRYLDRYDKTSREIVLDNLMNAAGYNLRKQVCEDVKPEVLLGLVLERAGVGLAGDNGVVGKITKAAGRLARNKEFIEKLVTEELKRHVRNAVKAVLDEKMVEQAADEIAELLKEHLPFNTREDLRKYYTEWWTKHGWCDMGEAVRIAVYHALKEVGGSIEESLKEFSELD